MAEGPDRRTAARVMGIAAVTAGLLAWLGRDPLCLRGDATRIWHGSAWSPHTSQHFLDPYSFTHLLHGFLFLAVLSLVGRARGWGILGLATLLPAAVALEGAWELIENSPLVIARYRANTASLEYSGDSILNSMGDLACCGTGMAVAYRLGRDRALAVFLATELALLAWIRDSLVVNMLMLVWPIAAIKAWQQG